MIPLYRKFSRIVFTLVNTFTFPSNLLHEFPLKFHTSLLSSSRLQCSRSIAINCQSESVNKRSCKFEAVKLKSRSLIRLQGPDTLSFLQGLITNDIGHFESKPAIYALFLNTQGRVLWDSLLYRVVKGDSEEESETFIECDSAIKDNLIKHLKIYRLRKKVDILDAGEGESSVDLWVVFDHGHMVFSKEQLKEECCGSVLQVTSKRADFPVSIDPSLLSFGDPRLNELGWRVFVPSNKSNSFPPEDVTVSDESSYRKLRYALGVAEGIKELPTAACLPLESNGDYLHGVSFHKGCYIGQELTARSHHTGIIRKRIMPFRLPERNNLENLDPSTLSLVSITGSKSLGKIRGISGTYGIGLIRIEEALSAAELRIQDVSVSLEKPFWWPREASKEKLTRQ